MCLLPFRMSRGRGRGRRQRGFDDDNGFEAWGGYMNAKKAKLEEQYLKDRGMYRMFQQDLDGKFQLREITIVRKLIKFILEKIGDDLINFTFFSEKETILQDGIFNGVAVFVNGYTDPTSDQIKRIMMMNGGIYHHYQSPRTTHIIASRLPDVKIKRLKGNEPIVSPKWISESMEAGKLLDYTNYLLYTAKASDQPVIKDFATTLTKAKDAKDEKFLGEFYNNSRLHHISTMGANFKEYVNELRGKHNGHFSARLRLKRSGFIPTKNAKIIMHIDMDCFFVSVGLVKHTELKGKAIAVTNSKGSGKVNHNSESFKVEMTEYEKRLKNKIGENSDNTETVFKDRLKSMSDSVGVSMSEIASCSYEARAKGVKNGMFMGAALKLCPELQTIPYDFESYQKVAKILYDTVAQYTLDIQAVSCDEMLVDLSDVLQSCGIRPEDFAQVLRDEIRNKTDCNASVGIGSSILLSRSATRKAKPDGIYHLKDDQASQFLKDVNVADLPGVGRTNSHKFKAMGIANCGQLQEKSLAFLQREFGPKLGQSLYNYCRGIDDRVINFEQERKSISAEVNYGIRFNDNEDMERFVGQLSEEVAMRMVKAGNLKGKQITLKIMVRSANAPEETAKFLGHGLCDSHSKGCTLSMLTNDHNVIKRETLLLMKMLKVEPKNLRGIGIQVSKLEKLHLNDMKGQTKSIMSFLAKKDRQEPIPSTSGAKTSSPIPGPSRIIESPGFAMPGPSRTSTPSTCTTPGPSSGARAGPSRTSTPSHAPYYDDIDEDILNELPEDIRLEIEQERAKNQKNRQKESVKQQDLSYSQFDQSVLDALPQDLQEELKNQYKKPEQERVVEPKSAFEMLMAKKQSPIPVKGKRGRKSKKNVKKLPRKMLFDDDQPEEEEEEIPEEPEVPELELNGKSDLSDVRQLLRAWIKHCPCPSKEDANQIVEFLKRKLLNQNDEFVYLLLKTFYRLSQDADNINWIEAYQEVTAQIQEFFQSNNHGKKLFLSV